MNKIILIFIFSIIGIIFAHAQLTNQNQIDTLNAGIAIAQNKIYQDQHDISMDNQYIIGTQKQENDLNNDMQFKQSEINQLNYGIIVAEQMINNLSNSINGN